MQNNSSSHSFIFRRIAAFLYDTLLLTAIFFVVTTVAVVLNDGEAIQNPGFYFVLYAVGFLFFSWFWRNGGQTLGMQAWRLKLVNEQASRLTYKQCLKRYVCGTFLFGITLLTTLFHPQGKALHDVWSNTKITFKNK